MEKKKNLYRLRPRVIGLSRVELLVRKRVELLVQEGDAALIREVAKRLNTDDPIAERLRSAIRKAAAEKQRLTFQEWLAREDEEDSA
jgi:hypothetical protein